MTFKKGVQADGSWWVYAGDSNLIKWEFSGAAPVDLTGSVITGQARKVDTDPVVALTATVQMTDPVAGVIHIGWNGDDVRTLLAGQSSWEGEYDIQVLSPGRTLPSTIHRGVMRAQMDVTRDGVLV